MRAEEARAEVDGAMASRRIPQHDGDTGVRAPRARTCVGCGKRDEPDALAHVVVAGGEIVFDRIFGRRAHAPRAGVTRAAPGRGAHVHPRPACLAAAPRGLSRSLRRPLGASAGELGRRLANAAQGLMVSRLLAAQRRRALVAGAAADAPLVIVAVDWFSEDTGRGALPDAAAVASGRAMAWKTKSELGDLLGGPAIASCSVLDASIASELVRLRAAVDAGSATARNTKRDAECSKCPEAR